MGRNKKATISKISAKKAQDAAAALYKKERKEATKQPHPNSNPSPKKTAKQNLAHIPLYAVTTSLCAANSAYSPLSPPTSGTLSPSELSVPLRDESVLSKNESVFTDIVPKKYIKGNLTKWKISSLYRPDQVLFLVKFRISGCYIYIYSFPTR